MNDKWQINCKEFESKLSQFLKGEIQEDEAKCMEDHCRQCHECARKLELAENSAFLNGSNEESALIIKKIESHFSRRIAIKVAGITILAGVGIYILLGYLLPMITRNVVSNKSDELGYALTDLVQFTIPSGQLKSEYAGNVTPFNIYRTIEYEQRLTGGGLKDGKVDLTLPLYFGRTRWNMQTNTSIQGGSYIFDYPLTKAGNPVDLQWGKIKEFSKGTKIQIAVYFETPVTTEAMNRMLEKVGSNDYHTWLAIDTGLKWDYANGKPYKEIMMHTPQWGFPMDLQLTTTTATEVKKDSNGRAFSMSSTSRSYDVTGVSALFIKEMVAFKKYSEKYFNAPEFTNDIESINRYIKGKGIHIKGAILECPTSEVLKLKNESNIIRVDIIHVDFDY